MVPKYLIPTSQIPSDVFTADEHLDVPTSDEMDPVIWELSEVLESEIAPLLARGFSVPDAIARFLVYR